MELTDNSGRISSSMVYSKIDDDFLFCHIRPGGLSLSKLIGDDPVKMPGTLLLLQLSNDKIVIEVNLETYELTRGSLLMIFPGNLIRTIGTIPPDTEGIALYYDTKFSRSVNINLTSIAVPTSVQRPRPVMHLKPEEAELLSRYFLLLDDITIEDTNTQIRKSIATSLTAAIFYQLVMFYHNRLPGEIESDLGSRKGSRRNDYVREFVRLVHIHYVRERSVSFYANKLFISTKYLSMLVKSATGRSAAAWIDDFVLMEAKNMLRFSGKNIQQVAYALNFPTQSSFGKFFKHLTGLSPSEFQKT